MTTGGGSCSRRADHGYAGLGVDDWDDGGCCCTGGGPFDCVGWGGLFGLFPRICARGCCWALGATVELPFTLAGVLLAMNNTRKGDDGVRSTHPSSGFVSRKLPD